MTIFDNITFKDLSAILQELSNLHDEILLGGNIQPPFDDEHFQRAQESWLKLKELIGG